MDGLMKAFAKSERTTTHFRDIAIAQIKIAYRIMEYLQPDSVFKSKDLNNDFYVAVATGEYDRAYSMVSEETYGCAAAQSQHKDAVELIKHLYPIYLADCKNKKEVRRQELLKELSELEEKDKEYE
jgi:hypothetical protein